jgi:hypothetical protein
MIRVYDERIRVLGAFRGRRFAWSPTGDRLTSVVLNRLEVHTVRGKLVFRRAVPGVRANQSNGLVWADGTRVVIGGRAPFNPPAGQIGVDLRTGRTWHASNRYFGFLSPDRTLVAGIARTARGFALRVARLDGIGARPLARRSPCEDVVEGDVQWLPDGESLVYDFKCQPARP